MCRCPLLNGEHPHGGLIGLLISIAGLAIVLPSSYAADPGERGRLEQGVRETADGLRGVCRVAWRYDNLRPSILRAVAPIGGLLNPPAAPVIHLSPGSPDYRKTVGEMMYWVSLYASQQERLAELASEEKATAPQRGAALRAIGSAANEELGEETQRVENELDHARGGYGRACAWAWPYINLRPMCHQSGFEAATILNPFIPVPKIRLSEASPDYKVVVAAMNHWEPKIPNAKARLKDLLDDRRSAESAAVAVAAANGKPLDKKAAAKDGRLAQMFKIYEQLKPALKQWRKDQYDLEMLAEPWYLAKCTLVTLQVQAQAIQSQIYAAEHDKDGNWVRTDTGLRMQLVAVQGQITRGQYELGKIERQIHWLRQEQAALAGKTDAAMEKWGYLCDALGRFGPAAHHKAMPLLDQWIAEEPRLWQCYLARGVARLHVGRHTLAIEDFSRVDSKLRLYGSQPSELALITALEAYALCKQNETRDGCKRFADAKKLDRRSWVVCHVRGWSNLERKKYSAAKSDFQMALSLSKNAEAEPHEAMALLLAACPDDCMRNGEKAVEHATKACELTKDRDWICLDTLGAAHAEAGDFDSAVKSANKALDLAPADSQGLIHERIESYGHKVPYRLK
jgi:tetratricopeptide (TPR) repeat protein